MNNKIKLWVDDIRPAPDSSWSEAKTVEQAIKFISNFTPGIVSLDHDIEGQPNDTFKSVAYFICHNKNYLDNDWERNGPQVFIHSQNPIAAEEMSKILLNYDILATIQPYEVPAVVEDKKEEEKGEFEYPYDWGFIRK